MKVEKLLDVVQIKNPKPEKFIGEKRYYSTGNINEYNVSENFELVKFENRPSRANVQPIENSVSFAKMKSTVKTLIVTKNYSECIFSTGMNFLLPSKNIISKYLYYYLISPYFLDLKDKYSGQGIMGGLSNKDLNLFKIPVPPLQEQEKIVKKLDNILESTNFEINSNMQKIEKIDYFYNSFLNSIFNNRNFKFTDLGNLCDLIGGGTPSKQNESFYEGDIPWATVGDMQDIEVSDTRLKINKDAIKNSSTKVIPSGNIIIATRVGLGKVSRLLVDTAINQDLKGVIPKIKKNIDEKFLLFWFQSKSNDIISAGTGATVQGVKLPFVRSLKIPILDIETQKHIGNRVESVFKSCEYLKNIYLTKVSLYETLRKSVINEAFEIKNDE